MWVKQCVPPLALRSRIPAKSKSVAFALSRCTKFGSSANSVDAQKRDLNAFMRFAPRAHKLRRFVLQFRAMLRWRSATKLNIWIVLAAASGFRFTAQFARTLRRDLEAVELSMTTPWGNGPIEGHINRIKAIKRQMYGQTGFELPQARVLPWDASSAA
jgi:transposase